jgi:hypothetical protein
MRAFPAKTCPGLDPGCASRSSLSCTSQISVLTNSSSKARLDEAPSRPKVGARVGRLDDEDIVRLNQAVIVFLGLAVSPRRGRKQE